MSRHIRKIAARLAVWSKNFHVRKPIRRQRRHGRKFAHAVERRIENFQLARPRAGLAHDFGNKRPVDVVAAEDDLSGVDRGLKIEVLDDVDLSWEQARRNIVTRGIALNGLVGRRFTVGTVECVGRRLAEPCSHLERLARPGLIRPLVHRAGLRADILGDGEIKLGDSVSLR